MKKLLTMTAACVMAAAMWAHEKSIVVLYENDVHCAIDGYARMAGLRDAIAAQDTAYVIMVSCGDFLQGGTAGALSQGQHVADVMRSVGYQAVTPGNHEFDYGTERMQELLSSIGAPVTCVNIHRTGAAEPCYAKYVMQQCGEQRIAFVGALTPETMLLESYGFLDAKGNVTYDLKPDSFYSLIQQAADEARNKGADYVVALLHVGERTQSMGYNSHLAIAATRGIDAVLDGHSHSVVPGEKVKNRDGREVCISQTGTQFAYVGKLLIRDGRLQTELIPTADIPYENARVKATTDSVTALIKGMTDKVVGSSRFPLEVTDEQGNYTVRCRETNAGDLVTDAYRHFYGTEIALENGGGLRNDIKAGTITYGDIVSLLPYNNNICCIKATGTQIIEALRTCTAKTPERDGSFPQCSGLKYTVNTATHMVSDVMVEVGRNGEYAEIDPERLYDVAVGSYYRMGGFYNVLRDCHVVTAAPTLCRDVVEKYIRETLGGIVPERYARPQGRIIIADK
jgi:2',3'-cyclic-nucleotide 2'-phosphodiesterase (5'-nucleotidase family)